MQFDRVKIPVGDRGVILDSFGTFSRSYPLEIGKRYVSNIEWEQIVYFLLQI